MQQQQRQLLVGAMQVGRLDDNDLAAAALSFGMALVAMAVAVATVIVGILGMMARHR